NAYVAGFRVAGKTGTSTDTTTEAATGEKKYMVSFVGFAPADDPEIAVLVILDNPSKESGISASGGVMAAPVVGNIMYDVLPYLGVEPDLGSGSESGVYEVKVPNVKTCSVEEARKSMESLGFNVKVVGSGATVTDQAPMANVSIAPNSTVIIYVGEDKPNKTVEVETLNGMSYRQAKAVLEQDGLFIRCVGVAPSDSLTIVVASQSISPGSEVAYGSVVQVTLIDNDSTIMESAG
ncbi:MAG: PASTA domain-containing protein, partial [Clostridiales bacterium]|nr:PASTA domain-containing protein [Clostridiales bacterium]